MTRPARTPRRPAIDWDLLGAEAVAARRNAWAPYSRYKVGAALLTSSGEVVGGCNVENATFGLSLCAERNAMTSAVAEGHREFVAIAVVTSSSPPAAPCGQCLQFMAEFCVDLEILLVGTDGTRAKTRLGRLLPHPFRWKGAGTGR
jgi:cytidine deaminase